MAKSWGLPETALAVHAPSLDPGQGDPEILQASLLQEDLDLQLLAARRGLAEFASRVESHRSRWPFRGNKCGWHW